MRGLMMDYQLSIPAILRRAQAQFPHKTVTSRRPDNTVVRHTYADVLERARRLAVALVALGVKPGDRVATLAWAGHEHLEAYLAIPSIGAVLHTLNLRLHQDDLAYIVSDADDRVLILDESLLPLFEKFKAQVNITHVVVISHGAVVSGTQGSVSGCGRARPDGTFDYEQLLASADASRYVEPSIDEHDAAAMCYTSGTTGRPKGVLYSHRAIMLHSLAQGLRDCLALAEDDTVLPIVPMFHVNAWGLPFTAAWLGCNQVFAGPHLDPESVLSLLVSEKVTLTAGVPTVWLGVLQELDKHPGAFDLSRLRAIVIGGSAAPLSMIRAYQERHGLTIVHAWGMTEMTPLGTLCNVPSSMHEASDDEKYRYRAKQGTPMPLVEIRARAESGFTPWDGQTMGELEVRGPWIASQYYGATGADPRFSDDGWFGTGDIVTIADRGCIEIADRAKDLVKSGGEWISSVLLETALMGHPAVAEAAVIAVPHPRWDERPLAVVVLKPGHTATADDLLTFLEPTFAKWWLPDAIEFIDAIPRTSVGKFKKSTLREQYRERYQRM
ncbi:MAG: long-chain fatty acid--CoA ligase [Acidobacteria bacterium RIFCSPLOWO2_02_FULL_65_29]|nr:MAG: long-chain fatty acid--CoA ligase [Acidobacteria bacterium RIFCSPLOWO2_02_FULL_65_29]